MRQHLRAGWPCLAVAISILLLSSTSWAARTVLGRITDPGGNPVPGLLVKAWDSDSPDDDDFMGSAYTNSTGNYRIVHAGGHWDPWPHNITKWRPDIYVKVLVRVGNDWVRTAVSRVYSDNPHRNDLTINLTVPRDQWITRKTQFRPAWHSLPFENSKFTVCAAPTCKAEHTGDWLKDVFEFKWALCGGMSLTALQDFRAGRQPQAFSASLKSRLVTNQLRTVGPTKWLKFIEWQAKPTLPHATSPHTIGYSTKGEWPKVRQAIDAGAPIILGLIRVQSVNPGQAGNNHQVLAYGYTYNDLKKQVKLYVYDPNYPNKECRVEFNIGVPRNQIRAVQKVPTDTGDASVGLRGFFVIGDDSGPPTAAIYTPTITAKASATRLSTNVVRYSTSTMVRMRGVDEKEGGEVLTEGPEEAVEVPKEEADFYLETVKEWEDPDDEAALKRIAQIEAAAARAEQLDQVSTRGGEANAAAEQAREDLMKLLFPEDRY